jgi:hypothetical protein
MRFTISTGWRLWACLLFLAGAASASALTSAPGDANRRLGREAGSLPGYDYSDKLKSAKIASNEETLDQWLTNPAALVPGAKMFFHLQNPQDRADVIAYLKERAK